jgi:GT2 family glycosyltransferase
VVGTEVLRAFPRLVEWRALVVASRPDAWWATGLPFLVGAFEAERAITPVVILGTLYFLLPYNLLQHLIAGAASDTVEGRTARAAVAITNLPLLALLVIVAGPTAAVAIAFAVAVAVSAPVVTARTRPDSIARQALELTIPTLLVVLPAASGLLVGNRSPAELSWLALGALATWVLAGRALDVADVADVAGLTPRHLAGVALVGYALSVLLTALLGPLGVAAAVGVGLYLLLPPMVLVGPTNGGANTLARARAGRDGLLWLTGAWLVVLLLRHWGQLTFAAWDAALALCTIATAVVLANILLTRLATYRGRTGPGGPDAVPSVTIVVPARDEAGRLAGTLASLRSQTYADSRILVVVEGSTDDSASVAAAALGPTDMVLVAPPVPDGWTGKDWACQVGVDEASTDLVLFVDTDTVLAPVALRILVETFVRRGDHLLSGVTRQAMATVAERIAVPGFSLMLLGFVPIWWSAITRGRPAALAFADGQLMLVRRTAYLEAGGHAASRGSLRDDIDLAHSFARRGFKVGTVHMADLALTHHGLDVDSAVARWRRTFVPYAGDSLAAAIATMVAAAAAFVGPLLLLPLAVVSDLGADAVALAAVPLGLLLLARVALVATQRQPLSTIAWHPVSVGVILVGAAAAIADHVLGRSPSRRGRGAVTDPSAPFGAARHR